MIDLLLAAADGVNYSLILDVAVCLFILIFALVGLSKGFFNCILKIFGTLGAILIAWFTAKPVLNFLNKIVNVTALCSKWMASYFTGDFFTQTMLRADNKAEVLQLLEDTTLFAPLKSLLKSVINTVAVADGTAISLADACSAAVGHLIATILVGVALFIVIKIVVALLAKLFDDAASKHNAINGMDKLLGLVFGLAKGALFLVVGFVAIHYATLIPAVNDVVTPVINDSTVTKISYNLVTKKAVDVIENTDWGNVVETVVEKLNQIKEAATGGTEGTQPEETPAPAAFRITLQD